MLREHFRGAGALAEDICEVYSLKHFPTTLG